MEFINADPIMKQMYYGICITAVLIRYFLSVSNKNCVLTEIKKIEKRRETSAANSDVVKPLFWPIS
jgi:hypothetical protein